jgi:two-component system CheB/CheR fusion protein
VEPQVDKPSVRALLIDDDEDDYVLTRELFAEFHKNGSRLDWETNYDSALTAMLRGEHDVYLLDLRLGARTGLDLLREARNRGFNGPTIMLTAERHHEADVEAMRAGVADYLVKGQLDGAMLERSIRFSIQQKRHEDEQLEARQQLERRVTERTAELTQANRELAAEVQERKLAEQRLRLADQRKNEFLAMLAHELRNPLAPLRNAIELLSAGVDAKTANWARELMQRQLSHLVRLVDELLDVSRITHGKIQLRTELVDLNTVVSGAVEEARPAMLAGQQFQLSLPQAAIWVQGDPNRLWQIISNLVGNAIKYTDALGRVTLEVEPGDRSVTIRIRDNGIGIEPQMLQQIFEPFTQLNDSLDRARGGLGIGLALVKRLVELHGGSVCAESEGLGHGSTFTVVLPTTVRETETPMRTAWKPTVTTARRVLVVDDNAGAAQTLARLVSQLWGHQVEIVHDGEAALRQAEMFRPDVVLLDIGLPGMDGYEVAARMRADAATRDSLLVALTGYGQDSDRQRALQAGFDEHLVKPASVEAFDKVFAHPKLANRASTVPNQFDPAQ